MRRGGLFASQSIQCMLVHYSAAGFTATAIIAAVRGKEWMGSRNKYTLVALEWHGSLGREKGRRISAEKQRCVRGLLLARKHQHDLVLRLS